MTTPATQQPADHTHGLSVQHADALWDAVAIAGPAQPTFPEQHERVCRVVARILDEMTPARVEPTAGQAALRDRIAEVLRECAVYDSEERVWRSLSPAWIEEITPAVLAVLPAPADRAAVYRELADQQEQTAATDVIRRRRSIATARRLFAAELRRMAAEAQQSEAVTHQPARSDEFERWLKAQRDTSTAWSDWHALDAALDLYRLHADTGTPLGKHVCEGQVVGDCECLEQAAAETPSVSVQHAPGKAIRCPDCRAKGYTVCLDEPAAGARQDGAQR